MEWQRWLKKIMHSDRNTTHNSIFRSLQTLSTNKWNSKILHLPPYLHIFRISKIKYSATVLYLLLERSIYLFSFHQNFFWLLLYHYFYNFTNLYMYESIRISWFKNKFITLVWEKLKLWFVAWVWVPKENKLIIKHVDQ